MKEAIFVLSDSSGPCVAGEGIYGPEEVWRAAPSGGRKEARQREIGREKTCRTGSHSGGIMTF